MGACSSSAALDPADISGDGSTPVYWSPERDQEKRLAKLRETAIEQQAEIERATGHLKKASGDRRSTVSKSADDEKQQADESVTTKAKEPVRPLRPARPSSRPASVSLPVGALSTGVVSEQDLSDYPLPRSARRHARATSASVSSVASATRSPEVSVSVGMRSEGEGLGTPQHQSTPMATRRASAVPAAVEEEGRQTEEEKEGDASASTQPSTASSTVTATATVSTPVRVVTLREVKVVEAVEKPAASSASAAFGIQLRKTPTVVKTVDMTAVPSMSDATS